MKKIMFLLISGAILMLIVASFSQVTAYSYYMENHNETENNFDFDTQFFGPDWYNKPNNYAELVEWYQDLESQYPDYIEVFKANEFYGTDQATGGYDLYYVRITNESLGLHKPEVLFLGGPHGDETVGTIGNYWFTDWLFRMSFTDETHEEFTKDYLQWILDNREIYLEVSHNPWGFDHGPQRYDANNWDLNRESDYDGPGAPTGGIWASNNGKTLVKFVNNHTIRVGCDFHGGVRMLIYPWASNHGDISGTSPISGQIYDYAPPDFYFYDAATLRSGAFIGDYGGNLNEYNIGTVPTIIHYEAPGGLAPWAYGSDVVSNPTEDPFVQDEIFGNYPGAGIYWVSPEMSTTKNPSENTFGNDTVHRYGAEVRRFIMHQTDLAQPYIRWQSGTVENNTVLEPDVTIDLNWQVNGSLVVDHTYIQWGKNPDPIYNPEYTTSDYDEFEGQYYGGTGWDNANDGTTSGVTYSESIYLEDPGDYYFVAKAQVDQVYAEVLAPETYGDTPFLRLVKERTDKDYYEVIEGTDGTEEIFGQTWWYSDIIHVKIIGDAPNIPDTPSGPSNGDAGQELTYSTRTTDPDGEQVFYKWKWGDGTESEWIGPFDSGNTVSESHAYSSPYTYQIRVKSKDIQELESDWSDPLEVTIPRARAINRVSMFLENVRIFIGRFPILVRILQTLGN